jgi:adenine deaminase
LKQSKRFREAGEVRHFFLGVLALAFGTLAPIAKAADISAATYVRSGKLLDVRSGKMLVDQVIVIRGDRIERFAASGEVQIPAGATTVDLTHATVLPGLIDCHIKQLEYVRFVMKGGAVVRNDYAK